MSFLSLLALGVVLSDLVHEELLNRVELFGLVEDDGGEPDVPAHVDGHSGAEKGGEPRDLPQDHDGTAALTINKTPKQE